MKTKIQPLLLPVLLMAIYACSPNQAKNNDAATENIIAVKTQRVTRQSVSEPIVTSGMLASKKEIKLSFKTGGIIAAIRADEGQSVKKGQLLAALNLTEISSQVSQAQQQYDKAQRDLTRAQNLYADSAATMEQVQNATTGLEVASAALEATQFNRQHSTIYAPANGQILKRTGEEGELVTAGNQVFVFASSGNEQWVIRTGVSDRDMVRTEIGDTAAIQFDAYPHVDFTATVTEIARIADPMKGTFEMELQVHPRGKKLASGMVAKIEIQPSQRVSSLMVPVEALTEADGDRGYVYVLNADQRTVKKVPVTIAGIHDSLVGIGDGLTENTTIVTEGTSYLTEDANVKVVK